MVTVSPFLALERGDCTAGSAGVGDGHGADGSRTGISIAGNAWGAGSRTVSGGIAAEIDVCQLIAISKSIHTYICDRIWDGDGGQICTSRKCKGFDRFRSAGKLDPREAAAILKRPISNCPGGSAEAQAGKITTRGDASYPISPTSPKKVTLVSLAKDTNASSLMLVTPPPPRSQAATSEPSIRSGLRQ